MSGLLISFTSVFGQINDRACRKAKVLIDKLETFHVEPKELDDSLSNDVFQNFIQLLDPNLLYLNQANIEGMDSWRYKIDDFVENRDCDFLDSALLTYKNRLIKTREILNTFAIQNFDFTKQDTLTFNYRNFLNVASQSRDLRGNWEQRLKYLILGSIWPQEITEEKIKSAFVKVISDEQSRIVALLDDEKRLASNFEYKFLQAIAKSYDPHTEYFSSSDKNEFDASLSNEGLSYGLKLSNDPLGNVIVAQLIPGSYAWQSNKIHNGDLLIKMKVADGKEIDISNYDAGELEYMLEGYDSKVQFTIRKANGSLNKVELEKQKITTDDNIVKSLILDGPNKIAYISLPSFYSEAFGGDAGSSADLASEIIALKKEGIEGVVLDLRNNGGGSLYEAVTLSGIFIDGGALGVTQKRDEKAITLKDPNRGTIYSGPLVIMINGASASASELFAGAMQDHNRGVLVGSTTYGKATGQTIDAVDRSGESFIKTTTLKFYRVTGDTHQGSGIKPDIFLPGMDDFGVSEASYHNTLHARHISKKTYYTKLDELPISELNRLSKIRINKEPAFDSLLTLQKLHNQYFKDGQLLIPVSIKGYNQFNLDFFSEKETDSDVWSTISIKLSEKDNEISDIDTYGSTTYRILSDNLQSDVHLREAYNILTDLIKIKQN